MTCSQHANKDTYSALAVDIAVQSCFFELQLTSFSPRNYMPLEELLQSSLHPAGLYFGVKSAYFGGLKYVDDSVKKNMEHLWSHNVFPSSSDGLLDRNSQPYSKRLEKLCLSDVVQGGALALQ
ncbi:hypothetical protein Tco_0664545 [Tanacetum coccineum]